MNDVTLIINYVILFHRNRPNFASLKKSFKLYRQKRKFNNNNQWKQLSKITKKQQHI